MLGFPVQLGRVGKQLCATTDKRGKCCKSQMRPNHVFEGFMQASDLIVFAFDASGDTIFLTRFWRDVR